LVKYVENSLGMKRRGVCVILPKLTLVDANASPGITSKSEYKPSTPV